MKIVISIILGTFCLLSFSLRSSTKLPWSSMFDYTINELVKTYGGKVDFYQKEKNGFLNRMSASCNTSILYGLKNNYTKRVCIKNNTNKTLKQKKMIVLDIYEFGNGQQAQNAIRVLDSLILKSTKTYTTCVDPKFLSDKLTYRVGSLAVVFNNYDFDSTTFSNYVRDFKKILKSKMR